MFAIFPEILQQAEKGDIEAVACLVRKYFGEQQVFVPNLRVAELCANAEIKIDTNIEKGAARLEAWDSQGQFRIVISIHPDIRSVREQNYILAHMLGHVFLDLQPKMAKGELQRTIFEKKMSPLRALLLEPESASPQDTFACSLLLPKAMVKKAVTALSSRKDAAAFFNVELPLLEFRMTILGLFGVDKAATNVQKSTAEPQGFSTQQSPAASAPRAAARSEKKSEMNPNLRSKEPALSRSAPRAPSVGEASSPRAAQQKANAQAPALEAQPNLNSPASSRAASQNSSDELSSVARVNRSVAARTYKLEGERPDALGSSAAPSASPGMERLRQLARKIDKSVDE